MIISECIPPSLRFFSGSEPVDLLRKQQEDPLYAIKKKEMETKSQLLKNPVRLKQLRDMVNLKFFLATEVSQEFTTQSILFSA